MAFAQRSWDRKERLDVACAELAATQFGLVTTAQVIERGGTSSWISRRVAAGLMTRVLPGVWRLRGFPDCWQQRAMAAALWAGPSCALSHRSAAHLWGLTREANLPITLVDPGGLKAPKPWVAVRRARQLQARDVTSCRGFPVTTPSRTLLDLGSQLSMDAVEDALDTALHRRLTSVARMKWQLEVSGGKGRRGTAMMRCLLRERDPAYRPTHSVLEASFRRLLKRHGFPEPSQQHVVRRGPATKAFVDFLYPVLHLAIELDGFASHGHRAAWQSDLHRQNDLVLAGMRVLRFTWDDLRHREQRVVEVLRPFFGKQLSLSERQVEKKL